MCVCCAVIYATFATFVISLALFFRIFPTFSCCFLHACLRVCACASEWGYGIGERGWGGGSLFVCFVLLTLLISPNAPLLDSFIMCARTRVTGHGLRACPEFAAVMCTLIDTWRPLYSSSPPPTIPPSASHSGQEHAHLWARADVIC